MDALLYQQAMELEYLTHMNLEAHFLEVNKLNLNFLLIYLDFDGVIKLAEMLFRTNIIGFVGTGDNTSYPATRLILWDDIQHRPFGELNFKTEVLNIKLRKDKVVVVLLEKIYVYNFQNLECSDSYLTCEN
jgi:hypothetical protein